MPVAVSLRDLVDELQMLPGEGTAYLNKVTGKIITVTDDDFAMVEMDNEFEEELEGGKSEAREPFAGSKIRFISRALRTIDPSIGMTLTRKLPSHGSKAKVWHIRMTWIDESRVLERPLPFLVMPHFESQGSGRGKGCLTQPRCGGRFAA